jgi:uncharacterized protein (TIGR02246 family)
MRKMAIGLGFVALCMAPSLAMAGYADDRAEIENLSNRYMVAVDAGDLETVMATWADDGVLSWVGGVEHGKEAIRKAMSGFTKGLKGRAPIPENATSRPRTHHQIINHVIDVDPGGTTAHSTAY